MRENKFQFRDEDRATLGSAKKFELKILVNPELIRLSVQTR